MKKDRDESQSDHMSRRMVFASVALALGGVVASRAVSSALAQQKISQADAEYQDTPQGGQRCAGCSNFEAPQGCKFVEGTIKPSGWCQLFDPKA